MLDFCQASTYFQATFYLYLKGEIFPFNAEAYMRKGRDHGRVLFIFHSLFCRDRINGTNTFASAAIYAFIRDYVNALCFIHNDRAGRAARFASATCQACIRNYVCHFFLPPSFSKYLYYNTLSSISKEFAYAFFKIFVSFPPFPRKFAPLSPLALPYCPSRS